ncbi:thioredoxin domain-containing protein, partial [Candidatus Woesearchaeota archaeon]|nr:thioredoxin domain-containing protein [Candidatus Woesearchaeota archaeon]
MAKKTAKKSSAKKTSTSVAKNASEKNMGSDDAVLKTVFIMLGIGVVIAAFFLGVAYGKGDLGGTTITIGQDTDKLVIYEYSEFECPYCGSFYNGAYKQIKEEYGDQVVFEFRHFPLSFHQNAQKASEAVECARDQDMFWELHDKIFENQQSLSFANLKLWAGELGMNQKDFDSCLDSGIKASIITEHQAEAQERGVRGTPSFWINGELIVGAQPFSAFKPKIDAALAGEEGMVVIAPTAPTQPTAPPEAPKPVAVSIDDDEVKGDPDAPVTIIEFSDYECPFCARHYEQTYQEIMKNYVDTGKVKLVFRDFPLSFHQNAQKAGEAAECAGEQGQYWDMHDKLF